MDIGGGSPTNNISAVVFLPVFVGRGVSVEVVEPQQRLVLEGYVGSRSWIQLDTALAPGLRRGGESLFVPLAGQRHYTHLYL